MKTLRILLSCTVLVPVWIIIGLCGFFGFALIHIQEFNKCGALFNDNTIDNLHADEM